MRRADDTLVASPPADLRLEPGDIVMATGTVKTMDRLETLFDAP